MSSASFNDGLLQFLQQSPTPFHAVANLAQKLKQNGFEQLDESDHWRLEKKRSYFVIRNDSALIGFRTGQSDPVINGWHVTGAHTDSPCLKIKPSPEIRKQNYLQLGVEVYGGALLYPWFDRDLSVAGRVDFQTKKGELKSSLIDFSKPVGFIPSLAIHLNRTANDGHKINQQKELPPILMQIGDKNNISFDELLLKTVRKQASNKTAETVLSHELMLYDTQAPNLVGLNQEFIASARLDNLLSCYLACHALIKSNKRNPSVLVCNDHEEVGSASTSGAQGPFLKSVLERIVRQATESADAIERAIHNSNLWSIDNAHGVHPNYADKHDDKHSPQLNAGPVIKINANQRYASNSQSIALFKSVCNKCKIPYQSFVMRSDMACGSTIGPITAAEIGIKTVDIGIASLGMHSIRELAGAKDAENLAKAVTTFYNR
ncbi:MAG: M18 family aminopeptidase [Pseudomonadota bacterium]|nr:M18 family aminopeptidase [Pseudomonadota bacterium]